MGIAYSLYTESFPPKSQFQVSDIPDLSGKVAIVTGANTGIGREIAKALLLHNAKVYAAARSEEKALKAIAELKAATGKDAIFLRLDLGDLPSVKRAAEEFLAKEKALHMLFNNAGVMAPPIKDLTAQGYDLQFGTNVLGHFYLTNLLLPALFEGAKSSPDGKARVVNTSSAASILASTIDFNTVKDSPARKSLGTQRLYAQSKLGNVLLSTELARRYGDQGIVSTSLNPGNLKSDLKRHLPGTVKFIIDFITYSTQQGALTSLWAGTSPAAADANGKYLIPWARTSSGHPRGQDFTLSAELWKWMEEQVKDV